MAEDLDKVIERIDRTLVERVEVAQSLERDLNDHRAQTEAILRERAELAKERDGITATVRYMAPSLCDSSGRITWTTGSEEA